MNKRPTPFWIEGMADEDRDHRVKVLFATLERKLKSTATQKDFTTNRIFVFVPDPPPMAFEAKTSTLDVHTLSWGVAGKAAVTEDGQKAKTLAPAMFDLWSDALFVLAFAATLPDDANLDFWITQALQADKGSATTAKTQDLQVPNYALITFDWGDWVDKNIDP